MLYIELYFEVSSAVEQVIQHWLQFADLKKKRKITQYVPQ